MRFEQTENEFVFYRGLWRGVYVFLLLPLAVGIECIYAGFLWGHPWMGAAASIFCFSILYDLIRRFSRAKVHYLRIVYEESCLECGFIQNGQGYPIWQINLDAVEGVAIVKKPDEDLKLYTLAGLVSFPDDDEEYLIDFLPFTQEFKKTLYILEEQFHLLGIGSLDPTEVNDLPVIAMPMCTPDGTIE